jgi:N-acetylmuramoyl-L-alanine amidase
MKILIDNGHGNDTAGKRSPVWKDGSQLLEWEFNRDIANRLHELLRFAGLNSQILVPEKNDISLQERVKRINRIANSRKCFVVSIHGNAAPASVAGRANGWECYTSKGETESDKIAEFFYNEAKKHLQDTSIRRDYTDGDQDKEANFYILRKTTCPAVLTENLFYDNEKECRFLMSLEGREIITQLHYNAIVKYLMSIGESYGVTV